MAEKKSSRLFDLPQTRSLFKVKGFTTWTKKENAYNVFKFDGEGNRERRTFRFGIEYDKEKRIGVEVSGRTQNSVMFSNREEQKWEMVPWDERETWKKDGYTVFGFRANFEEVEEFDGSITRVNKSMTEFDATSYLNNTLDDGMSVRAIGEIDYSSYKSKDGSTRTSINLRATSLYGATEPRFDDDEYEILDTDHYFSQTIVYTGIEPEEDIDGKRTGRFVVSGKVVTYNNIIDIELIVPAEKSGLAKLIRGLKPYTAIRLFGTIDMSTQVEEVATNTGWGADPNKKVVNPTVREFIISGGDPDSIDTETYTKNAVEKAIEAINAAKQSRSNYDEDKEEQSVSSDWNPSGIKAVAPSDDDEIDW